MDGHSSALPDGPESDPATSGVSETFELHTGTSDTCSAGEAIETRHSCAASAAFFDGGGGLVEF